MRSPSRRAAEPAVPQALLWDVDGTLAESERDGHRVAFNDAFASMGLPWSWSIGHYGQLLRITGGRERLLADMAGRPEAPALAGEREALARELHRRKNARYAELVQAGAIALRDGVRELIEEAAAAGVRQGIVSTTSRSNAQALLARHFGPHAACPFDVMVCGEDVGAKKPDPEAYLLALRQLRLEAPAVVAIEDSPGGVAAAVGAGVPVLVTRSAYFAADTVEGAIAIGPGLHERHGWVPPPAAPNAPGAPSAPAVPGRVTLADIRGWHARMEHVSQFG
ncbi:MAG: HAD-IA family hydrolase [Rubrivivax sp.]|nr:HAD-IA family hydrolase [Rubrivivax sp.]